jgi:hypothetical protein
MLKEIHPSNTRGEAMTDHFRLVCEREKLETEQFIDESAQLYAEGERVLTHLLIIRDRLNQLEVLAADVAERLRSGTQ